jgi:hypothetical protein
MQRGIRPDGKLGVTSWEWLKLGALGFLISTAIAAAGLGLWWFLK